MEDVYQDWAEAMQDLTLNAINHGVIESKSGQFPPSQGEFIANCKLWKGHEGVKRLEHKLTHEQIEINRSKVAELVAKFLGRATGGSDPAKEA